jgi:hypothetical protein
MNFTQLQERLRVELLRRIRRGILSVSLLARLTGFGQSHVSGFLHNRKQLSLQALDRMLAAQHLAVADLLPTAHGPRNRSFDSESTLVPVISHSAALFEPNIRPSAVQWTLQLPSGAFRNMPARTTTVRRTTWERYVAVRISSGDAEAMHPLVLPDALAVIDRHYNSLVRHHPDRPNLYAVRDEAHLTLRYCDFLSSRLVLRPLNNTHPVSLIEIGPESSPGELIAGRIALIINEP